MINITTDNDTVIFSNESASEDEDSITILSDGNASDVNIEKNVHIQTEGNIISQLQYIFIKLVLIFLFKKKWLITIKTLLTTE